MDDKGRLKLPAEFKRICDEKYPAPEPEAGAKFFMTWLYGKRVEIFPMQEWEKIEAQIEGLAGPAKKRFLFEANKNGNVAEMDSQGRLLVPARLRESLGLTAEALVLGMQTHLTVMAEKALEDGSDAASSPLSDEDLATLNIPGL